MSSPFVLLRRLLTVSALWAGSAHAVDNVTVQNVTYSTTQTVQADNSITATPAVTVANGGNVTFQAGARITLGPGFRVNTGGVFHAYVGQSLPYVTGFETGEGYVSGTINNQRGWIVSQGAAELSTFDHFSGARSLSLLASATPAKVRQSFALSPTPALTFLDLYVVPVANATAENSTLVETGATRIGFQIVSGQGKVYAFDGVGANAWVPAGAPFSLNGSNQSSGWVHLTLRIDYVAKKWDVYVNGILAEYDLAFASNGETYFRTLELSGASSAAAYIDLITAGIANPLFTDVDKDGMADSWEISFGLNPNGDDRNGNLDADAYTNIEEYFLGTAPNAANGGPPALGTDTDHDGLPDAWELAYFGNLTAATGNGDNDGDGISNAVECLAGTNPLVNEASLTMPSGVQVILRQPIGGYQGVKPDWSIIAVP